MFTVLEIVFGPTTAESKNRKISTLATFFLGPQLFGPPKMSLVP